ncbi:hypothetical protein DITRI_Ditri07aG0024000 [Diplodiscus trichospermus]
MVRTHCIREHKLNSFQGAVFAGDGEKNGMDGHGIVVGMNGFEGRGGWVSWAVGMVGIFGMLASGGRVPGLDNGGWLVGNGGCGRFGINGSGGSIALGKVGIGDKGGSWRR